MREVRSVKSFFQEGFVISGILGYLKRTCENCSGLSSDSFTDGVF